MEAKIEVHSFEAELGEFKADTGLERHDTEAFFKWAHAKAYAAFELVVGRPARDHDELCFWGMAAHWRLPINWPNMPIGAFFKE